MLARVQQLHEQNPMLGLRVCRLGIVFPEIYAMQVRAIFEAACDLRRSGRRRATRRDDSRRRHERRDAHHARRRQDALPTRCIAERGVALSYHIGTMIELPRACVVADELAAYAEFFSFGTNDLTQTTYGYSRDDAEASFIPVYLEKRILKDDPFQVLDREGVGALMRQAVELGRGARAGMKIGICGEHGGEPSQRRVLRPARPRLRLVLAVSRSDRAPRRRASRPSARCSNQRRWAATMSAQSLRASRQIRRAVAHEELAPVGFAAELRDQVGDLARVDERRPACRPRRWAGFVADSERAGDAGLRLLVRPNVFGSPKRSRSAASQASKARRSRSALNSAAKRVDADALAKRARRFALRASSSDR